MAPLSPRDPSPQADPAHVRWAVRWSTTTTPGVAGTSRVFVVTAHIACTPCRVRRDGGDVDRPGRRACVLAARARRRGGPAGGAARGGGQARSWCAPCGPGVSRGTETLVFRGGVPPVQYAHDAGALPGGRLPRAGEVRLPQRRRRRAGTGRAARPHRVLSVPAPDRLRRAGRRGDRRARRRAAGRAVLAGTVETAVNALWDAAPCSATGSLSSEPAWSAAASRGCSRRHPGAWVTLVDVDPGPGGWSPPHSGSSSRCRRTPPAAATSSSTRARRRPGSAARLTCSRPRARSSTSAGTATARCGCRWAAPSTPAAWASGRARSAPSHPPAARRRTTADRLALALELLRDPAFDALLTGQSRFANCPR